MLVPLKTSLRDTWADAQRDLRTIRWNGILLRKIVVCCLVLIWTLGLGTLLIVLALFQHLALRSGTACGPDGEFITNPDQYSFWSETGIFQVTLGFGDYSFAKAKLIDVAWDVAFGRLGQTFLAFCSWRVFTLYVTTSMETAPITYDSFRAFFIGTGPSLWTTLRLIRDFALRKRLHSSIAMVFIVAAMLLTLAFPTFAGAMTSYTSIVKAYVPDHDSGNQINFDSFLPVLYVIHDGNRIDQAKDYLVTDSPKFNTKSYDPILIRPLGTYKCSYARGGSGRVDAPDYDWYASVSKSPFNTEECYMQNNVSKYVEQYGFNASSNVKTTFMGIDLDPPTLNISASFFYDPTLYGSAQSITPQNRQAALWLWSNQTYNYTYVSTFGTCQPDGGNYQWGFSFIQLFAMNIMLLIWTLGMLIMWYRAQSAMRKRGRASVAGVNKAVVELAEAMHRELDSEDFSLRHSTEGQIKQRIAAVKGGGIAYNAPLIVDKVPDASFREWIKREKWWLVVTLVFFLATSILWIVAPIATYGLIFPTCGLIFALSVGSTIKSRTLFFLVWGVLGLVVGLSVGLRVSSTV